jgi:KUP system potassium uptake protein
MSDAKAPPESQAPQTTDAPPHRSEGHNHGPLAPLALGALGIVFGDIGTSPLYAVAECFSREAVDGHFVAKASSLEVTPANVLGILSLFFWSLTMVVTVKYLSFIMKADNKGQGGIFALLALVPHKATSRIRAGVVLAALFGAALLYGDGIITPAISVLSAVEGLSLATSALDQNVVVLVTLVILVGLFLVQKRGTDFIGKAFGPWMLAWFVVLSGLGILGIVKNPGVLQAVNPWYAYQLFVIDPMRSFKVLGSVVLCITGGEALYADMGHFGARPIRVGWYSVVLPSLLLNYFGQGAFLMEHGFVEKPFWALVPEILLYPMVALATGAAVIASQALISGAFSLTRQAVQLGYMPRVTIVHTSAVNEGQIYIPEVNSALMVACLALVLIFKQSTALAGAYGIAVTGTMSITSIVYFVVTIKNWGWKLSRALPLVLLFLAFDIPFFLANALKFFEGGWFPIVLGLGMFAMMTTWKRGRAELAARFNGSLMPIAALLEDLEATKPFRVRGTAVFMSGNSEGTPPVLLHHLKHNQVLHRQVVLLSILPQDVPVVPQGEQIDVENLGNGFFRVLWKTGFMETPNVPKILVRARQHELVCEPSTTSYFLGRETLLTNGKSPMMLWRKLLFAFISRNALSATSYFGLPPGRVVELGIQVDL